MLPREDDAAMETSMQRHFLMASAALVLACGTPALATEISPSEAESIQQRLTRYLPQELVDAGLVTVRAASSFYELRFDPAALLDKVKAGAVTVTGLKPMTAYMRPMPEGTYRIEANDSLDIMGSVNAAPAKSAFTYRIDKMTMDGIYDPEILYFTAADWTAKGIAFSNTTDKDSVTARFGETAMRLSTEKKEAGKLDISTTGVMQAFAETITNAETGRVDIGAEKVDIDVSMDGARYKVIQDLTFFVLDNIDKQELAAADETRLKELLRSAMPVFDNLTETIKASNLTVGTDKGTFGADSVTYNIDMNGVAHATRLGIGVAVDGPKPPAGLLPAAFAEAVPERAAFKVAVTDLDLAGALTYALDHADLSKEEPLTEEQQREVGRIVLPGGAMTVAFEEVSAVSPIYDVHLTGTMQVYPDQQDRRSADVTITMRSFDKTVAYLQKNAATVPQFGQAAFGLLMMKGLARDGGDGAQVWNVKAGEDGKILINGQPLPFQQ
jgi:hypothetical protein